MSGTIALDAEVLDYTLTGLRNDTEQFDERASVCPQSMDAGDAEPLLIVVLADLTEIAANLLVSVLTLCDLGENAASDLVCVNDSAQADLTGLTDVTP